jgi:hypothetical protein
MSKPVTCTPVILMMRVLGVDNYTALHEPIKMDNANGTNFCEDLLRLRCLISQVLLSVSVVHAACHTNNAQSAN